MSNIKPHCWGFAASFNPTGKTCKSCPSGISCAKQALANLREISSRLSVTDLIHKTQTYLDNRGVPRDDKPITDGAEVKIRFAAPLTAAEPVSIPLPANLASKPRKLATAICKAGINMRLDSQYKVNNFPAKFRPTYMRKVQDLINKGSFTAAQLKQVISEDRPLSEGALNNASSITIAALEAMKVIVKIGEEYEPLN